MAYCGLGAHPLWSMVLTAESGGPDGAVGVTCGEAYVMVRTASRLHFGSGGKRLGPTVKGAALAAALALTTAIGPGIGVGAQQAAESPTQGITVIGYGQASATAETAEIQLVASQVEYGAPRPPDPGATPGAEERQAVGPMVEAIKAAGVPEADINVVISAVIGVFYGPGGPGVARVDVSIDNPTPERVREIIDAGIVGAAQEDLVLYQIGVGYGVADCAPLERQAREAALNDARTRGELQAELMGVSLGTPVAASDVPVNYSEALGAFYGGFAPTQITCSPPAPAPTSGAPVSVPPYDPTDESEVNVYAQTAVTYEIGSETMATPAA